MSPSAQTCLNTGYCCAQGIYTPTPGHSQKGFVSQGSSFGHFSQGSSAPKQKVNFYHCCTYSPCIMSPKRKLLQCGYYDKLHPLVWSGQVRTTLSGHVVCGWSASRLNMGDTNFNQRECDTASSMHDQLKEIKQAAKRLSQASMWVLIQTNTHVTGNFYWYQFPVKHTFLF